MIDLGKFKDPSVNPDLLSDRKGGGSRLAGVVGENRHQGYGRKAKGRKSKSKVLAHRSIILSFLGLLLNIIIITL